MLWTIVAVLLIFRSAGSGDQFVSVFLQHTQLTRIPVDTKQSIVGRHALIYISRLPAILPTIAHLALNCRHGQVRASEQL